MSSLSSRLTAEFIGTLFLLASVVGSGIMAERLTADVALILLCNGLATAGTLFVMITVLAPVSGAHFNPAVTLVMVLRRSLGVRDAVLYVVAQIAGGILGVLLAHAMFGELLVSWGTHSRTGAGQWLSEGVATFGLVLAILGVRRRKPETIGAVVGLYILAAYWFAASTSFANPAVTIARTLTPTFSGIVPGDAGAFVAAQICGAVIAGWFGRLLFLKREGITD